MIKDLRRKETHIGGCTTSGELIIALESLERSVELPYNATNGDVIMAMFPDAKIHEHKKTDICDAYIQIDIWDFSICVSKDWWNAPYGKE